MLPRSSQLDAKIAQESPTCGQDRPKYSPRASNQTPQDPKMWPKRCSVVRFYTSAIFLKIAPKTTKNAQKSSPNGLKMAILAPTWGILAPSWRHLGPILAQFGEILADPSPAKIDQNLPGQLLRVFRLQVAPRSSQTLSKPRFCKFLGPLLSRFRQFFRMPFYRFCFECL